MWILTFSGSQNDAKMEIHNDDSIPFSQMTVVTLPAREILWILKQVGVLMSLYVCVFFSLESGTVESHCSEGGISDVTAARHTKDL